MDLQGFSTFFGWANYLGVDPLFKHCFSSVTHLSFDMYIYIYTHIHILIAFCSNTHIYIYIYICVSFLGWRRRQGYPDACDSMFIFFWTSRAWQEGTKATGIDVGNFPVEVNHPLLGYLMAMAVFFDI